MKSHGEIRPGQKEKGASKDGSAQQKIFRRTVKKSVEASVFIFAVPEKAVAGEKINASIPNA